MVEYVSDFCLAKLLIELHEIVSGLTNVVT